MEDGWLRADGTSLCGLHFIRVYSCRLVIKKSGKSRKVGSGKDE